MTASTFATSGPKRPTDTPAIPVHFSRLVAREIGARGKELRELLHGTGVSPRAFMYDDILLTMEQQTVIAMNAMRLSGDEGIGLRLGRLLTPEAYGPLGFLVSASPDLQTALTHFRTFLPTRIPFVELHTAIVGDSLACRLEVRFADDTRMVQAAVESIGLSLCAIVEDICGSRFESGTFYCRYPPPHYAQRYGDYFPVPVEFSSNQNCLVVDRSLATAHNPIASKANYALALQQCRSMIATLPGLDKSTADRVKQVLLSSPPGTLTEQNVADLLCMSRRTLARRLAAEGSGFSAIQAAILADIGASNLRNSNDTVESIAALLNYYDASNFRRAFKKWFKMTPEEFRKSHRTSSDADR